jgi:predicted O-methyltransferase YrrM
MQPKSSGGLAVFNNAEWGVTIAKPRFAANANAMRDFRNAASYVARRNIAS